MIDVTVANFETEVILASRSTPVLIDFWAPWCGPCKTIGPMLEKLEETYGGRFKLVKINSDDEQQLAAAFGIRSIPTCILMFNGQPVDGFMGALPQSQIEAFLDKHLPPPGQEASDALGEEDAAQDDLMAPSAPERRAALAAALEKAPEDDNARFDYIQALLLAGDVAAAKAAFEPARARAAQVRRWESVALLLQAMDSAATQDIASAKSQYEAQIARNKRDFPARFAYAQALIAALQWTAAMDELLEIVMRDKLWDKEGGDEGKARKLCIAVLDIIDPPKPKMPEGQIPSDDPTVARYRRRLSSIILS